MDGDSCHPHSLYSLSRKTHLKGILLLDSFNWGSKVPHLVYRLKLAYWMHGWAAAMARTCRVLGCINETQDWVPWSCNHVERVDKTLLLTGLYKGPTPEKSDTPTTSRSCSRFHQFPTNTIRASHHQLYITRRRAQYFETNHWAESAMYVLLSTVLATSCY